MVNLFNKDFRKFYKLNLLIQPKVIKSISKYLDMMQKGELSQLFSETFRFKSSLNIWRFQGSSFLECDRIKVLTHSEQKDHYIRQLLGNDANREKCGVSVGKISYPIENSWKYSTLTSTNNLLFSLQAPQKLWVLEPQLAWQHISTAVSFKGLHTLIQSQFIQSRVQQLIVFWSQKHSWGYFLLSDSVCNSHNSLLLEIQKERKRPMILSLLSCVVQHMRRPWGNASHSAVEF